jgi:hypothetical protein
VVGDREPIPKTKPPTKGENLGFARFSKPTRIVGATTQTRIAITSAPPVGKTCRVATERVRRYWPVSDTQPSLAPKGGMLTRLTTAAAVRPNDFYARRVAAVEKRERAEAAARPGASAARGRFFRAALLGSILALLLDLWLLAGPHPTLLRDQGLLGSFFDVQGHALLHGHLDVDPAKVSFEGFRVGGRTYTYFGLFPALLRLPVLAVTDELDGRLTQVSMLLAFIVLLAAGAQLHWRVRSLVRPRAPLARSDQVAAFLLQLALGAAAVPLYLASRPIVYHEAELWGAALAVGALAAAVAIVERPTTRRIATAGLLATLAVNARFSVGLGPILALAVLAAGLMARLSPPAGGRAVRLVASFGPQRVNGRGGGTLALLAAAVVVPLAVYGAVNTAKFGRPFGIPIEKQVASRIQPARRAALAANGGSIFGLKFVPTTLLQAVRPDALGSLRAFPFVGLPHAPATVLGDVRFDTIEPSLSAPTSMPVLCLLTIAGLIELLRRRRLRPVLGILAGTAGGFALTLTIAFVTTRYLADLLPFLLLGGLVGLQALLASDRRRKLVLGGVAALTLFGIVIDGSVGLVTQRLLYEPTEPERAAFVRMQDDVDRFLGRRPHGVLEGPNLPPVARGSPGDLFVVGRCAGLYVEGLQHDWLPVERTERDGLNRLRVHFPAVARARPEALLTLGSGSRRVVVSSRGGAVRMAFAVRLGGRVVREGRPLRLSSSRPSSVVVSVSFFSGGWYTGVRVNGKPAVTAATPDVRRERPLLGADPGGLPRFSGRVESVEAPPRTCRALASRVGLPKARR